MKYFFFLIIFMKYYCIIMQTTMFGYFLKCGVILLRTKDMRGFPVIPLASPRWIWEWIHGILVS